MRNFFSNEEDFDLLDEKVREKVNRKNRNFVKIIYFSVIIHFTIRIYRALIYVEVISYHCGMDRWSVNLCERKPHLLITPHRLWKELVVLVVTL